jgi:hypothetical protein
MCYDFNPPIAHFQLLVTQLGYLGSVEFNLCYYFDGCCSFSLSFDFQTLRMI